MYLYFPRRLQPRNCTIAADSLWPSLHIKLVLLVLVATLVGHTGTAEQGSLRTQYINSWQISPLYGDECSLQHIEDEMKTSPTLDGVHWSYFDDRLFSRNYDNYQDLFSYFRIKKRESVDGKVALLRTFVYSRDKRYVTFELSGDDRLSAWLDNALIADFVDGKGMRGSHRVTVECGPGWSMLLLRIEAQSGGFGFYCGFEEHAESNPLLFASGIPGESLNITTSGMPEATEGNMPVAWIDWPYVEAHASDVRHNSEFQRTTKSNLIQFFSGSENQVLNANAFQFQASGGMPPYTWNLGEGDLPPGLSLGLDGTISGVVSGNAEPGSYPFTVWVQDANQALACKQFEMSVRPRPTKWFESAGLTALMHNKRQGMPQQEIDHGVALMKERGYQSAVVISYNNGDDYFRWPSEYSRLPVEDDLVARTKDAIVQQGMRFGMYLGNLQNADKNFPPEKSVRVLLEALERYQPEIVWLDWSGIDHVGTDAMYSVIRSYSPETIIVVNGHVRGGTLGDWDVVCFEGWGAWGEAAWNVWPTQIPWPKKHTPESWRYLNAGADGWPSGNESAWKDMLKVQVSLICEGFIADIDHSFDRCGGDFSTNDGPSMFGHYQKMADWTSPEGLPERHSSFTHVKPGPFEDASWGYSVINESGDTIYLHIMETPRGKVGLPDDETLTVGPLPVKVSRVTLINTGVDLPFEQAATSTNNALTIDISNIVPDDVDTIIRIDLKSSLNEHTDARHPSHVQEQANRNLALNKQAYLKSTDGKRLLIPSRGKDYADNGVDGDTSTVATGAWEWAWSFEVDLERSLTIDELNIWFAEDGYPTQYRVQTSFDGSVWANSDTIHNASGGHKTVKLEPQVVRFIRIEAITPNGPGQEGKQMSIAELQVSEAEDVLLPINNAD